MELSVIPTFALILFGCAGILFLAEAFIAKSLAMIALALVCAALVVAIAGVGPVTHLAVGPGVGVALALGS